MTTIYKYSYTEGCKEFTLTMPAEATILSTHLDANDDLCFWALVDTSLPLVERTFYCVGTGWDLEELNEMKENSIINFIGTVKKGQYIWHLFEFINDEESEN